MPGHYQCLEKAEIVREGRDVTILCYSRMRYVVMQAVTQLEKSGYDPEVCFGLQHLPSSCLHWPPSADATGHDPTHDMPAACASCVAILLACAWRIMMHFAAIRSTF